MQGAPNPNQPQPNNPKDQSKKTKPIKKQKKPKKKPQINHSSGNSNEHSDSNMHGEVTQTKKERRSSGALPGRPSRKKGDLLVEKVAEDPTMGMQQCLLQHLTEIGLSHGLSFRPKERQKFINEQLGIKWNQQDEWSYQKQKQKILQNPLIITPIKAYLAIPQTQLIASDPYKKQLFDLIIKIYLNISETSAEECTEELYRTLSQAFESINLKEEKDEALMETRAKGYLGKLKFLNGSFTKERERYWVNLKNNKAKVQQSFVRFFKKVIKQLTKILADMKKIKAYLNEKHQAIEDLKKIKSQ